MKWTHLNHSVTNITNQMSLDVVLARTQYSSLVLKWATTNCFLLCKDIRKEHYRLAHLVYYIKDVWTNDSKIS